MSSLSFEELLLELHLSHCSECDSHDPNSQQSKSRNCGLSRDIKNLAVGVREARSLASSKRDGSDFFVAESTGREASYGLVSNSNGREGSNGFFADRIPCDEAFNRPLSTSAMTNLQDRGATKTSPDSQGVTENFRESLRDTQKASNWQRKSYTQLFGEWVSEDGGTSLALGDISLTRNGVPKEDHCEHWSRLVSNMMENCSDDGSDSPSDCPILEVWKPQTLAAIFSGSSCSAGDNLPAPRTSVDPMASLLLKQTFSPDSEAKRFQDIGSSSTHSHHRRLARSHSFVRTLRWFNTSRSKYIMHPCCKKRFAWDLISASACTYDIIILPLLIVSMVTVEISFEIVLAAFWTIDVFMNFFTGFLTPMGIVEQSPDVVVRRYLKSWFPMDCSLVFLDWTSILLDVSMPMFRTSKSIIRMLRCIRVLRLLKLVPRLRDQLGYVNSELAFEFLRLSGYIFCVLILNHYIACVWHSIWKLEGSLDDRPAKTLRYLSGLHWALSHSMLSAMDIAPSTIGERLYTCCVLVVALVMFSTLLAGITQDALHIRLIYAEQNEKQALARKFFTEHRLPADLACQVWYYIKQQNYMVNSRKAVLDDIFPYLPDSIREELTLEVYRKPLVVHPFLAYFVVVAPNSFREICATAIEPMHVLPHEEFVPSKMVFVEAGDLEYQPRDEEISVNVKIKSGQWFGESFLWCQSACFSGPIVTGNLAADLLLLCPKQFANIVSTDSVVLPFVRNYARTFAQTFHTACRDFQSDKLLFNDKHMCEDLTQTAKSILYNRNLGRSRTSLVTNCELDDGIHPRTTTFSELPVDASTAVLHLSSQTVGNASYTKHQEDRLTML